MNPDLEWQRRYEESDTPWDKGMPAPALVNFLRQQPISGRVLVPGCGRGHEVREIGRQPQTSVVGLDISPTAIAQAKNLEGPSEASVFDPHFTLLDEWVPKESFPGRENRELVRLMQKR